MKPAPLLLGAALLFWGWHTGLWWLGLILGVLTELPQRLDMHWELSEKDRRRVADLCSLLMVPAGVYLYFTQPRLGQAIILLLQWLPMLLFPLLAVQIYGGRKGVELSALFFSLRGKPEGKQPWDLRPAYLMLCLLAAAMVPPNSPWYFPLLGGFAAWALWTQRPKRRAWLWAGMLALALGLGHGIGLGMQAAQRSLEDLVVDMLAEWIGGSTDPYQVTTAIGEVGRLKLSERIVLRVRGENLPVDSFLLRTAGYDRFYKGTWLARHHPFEPLRQIGAGWQLASPKANTGQVEIEFKLSEGRAILPLPSNTRQIQGLRGADLSRNPYGTVKVLQGPASARYRADYGEVVETMAPQKADLWVPPAERPVMADMVKQLGLDQQAPSQALEKLQTWFEDDFRYSLRLDAPPIGISALEHFLRRRRAGHCEYFASSGVLLLRQAGIPARYTRGWSVQEYSQLEQAYVVRARHAHAWVQAWIDGAWRNFDPTPPGWEQLEADNRPWWGTLHDLLSRLGYLLAQRSEDNENHSLLTWLLVPLFGLLIWRIARRSRRRQRRRQAQAEQAVLTSPFAPVEALLALQGLGRHPGETLREWTRRLPEEPPWQALQEAVELYYRRRFDPAGLTAPEDRRLRQILEQIGRP